MSAKLHIPTIAITPDAEEDVDYNSIPLAECLTDVEDLDVDTNKILKAKMKKRKQKLIIKLKEKEGGTTDLEDVEASDNEEEFSITKHEFPIPISNMELNSEMLEETYKIISNSQDRKKLITQHSISKTPKEEIEENFQNALTDIEDFNTDVDLTDNEISDIDIKIEMPETMNITESIRNSRQVMPSPLITPPLYYSDEDSQNISNKNKNFLFPKATEDQSHTDIELLNDSDNDSKKKVRRIKKRRPKYTLRNRGGVTDIEDLEFSNEDAVTGLTLIKSKVKDRNYAFSHSKKNAKPDSDTENDAASLHRKPTKFGGNLLLCTSLENEGLTDIENLESDYVMGKNEKHLEVEKGKYDCKDISNKNSNNMNPTQGKIKRLKCIILNDPLSSQSDQDFTDVENMYSSENRNSSTDYESVTSDFDENKILMSEFNLPPPTRRVVLIKESNGGKECIEILRLDKKSDLGIFSVNVDVEESDLPVSSDDDIILPANLMRATPDLPILEGGAVEATELLKSPRKMYKTQFKEVLTDVENIIISDEADQLNLLKKNPKKLTVSSHYASKTDTEDVYLSDKEGHQSENCLPSSAIVTNIDGSTDVEDMYDSDSDALPKLAVRSECCTPQHLRYLGGEVLFTKEGSGPFTSSDRLVVNKKIPKITNFVSSPVLTDTEDIAASNDEGNDPVRAATPTDFHTELDNMVSSKVYSKHTRKANLDAPEEAIYTKRGRIKDVFTDVEDITVSEEEKEEEKFTNPEIVVRIKKFESGVSLNWKDCSVTFGFLNSKGTDILHSPLLTAQHFFVSTITANLESESKYFLSVFYLELACEKIINFHSTSVYDYGNCLEEIKLNYKSRNLRYLSQRKKPKGNIARVVHLFEQISECLHDNVERRLPSWSDAHVLLGNTGNYYFLVIKRFMERF